jgi:hypothetical protein
MRRLIFLMFVAVSMGFLQAEAATRDDFLMQTTQNLVNVCSVQPEDPLYGAALGFCYGYGVGTFQYYQAYTGNMAESAFVCVPEPTPPRSNIVQWFLAWARDHPQYMNERPVDGFFRFLQDTWPCRR